MATPDQLINAKFAALKSRGFDLGSALSGTTASGSGGFARRFAHGNIYWHANTGAFEVHGGVLTRYLDGGGPGANPATGERELGYPTSDEHSSLDGEFPYSNFEWGTIGWVRGTGGVRLFGPLHSQWRALGGELGTLGHPLIDVTRVAGGRAAWFERGVLWHADGSSAVLLGMLVPPQLGSPLLADPTHPSLPSLVRFGGAIGELTARPALAAELWRNRLTLLPVPGAPTTLVAELVPAAAVRVSGFERSLDFTVRADHPGNGGVVVAHAGHGDVVAGGVPPLTPRAGPGEVVAGGIPPLTPRAGPGDVVVGGGPPLVARTLYSLALRSPGRAPIVVSPHCVYARSQWESFNVAHITDLHISRRIESYRHKLRAGGVPPANIAQLNNWNDAFRDFIRYANHLHAKGMLDAIIATGDLVDYVREIGDHPKGPGNFRLFENLVRGQAPSPDPESSPSQALRVPIFTCLGNHDYRANPYPLAFKVKVTSGSIIGEIPIIGDVLEDIFNAATAVLDAVPGLGLSNLDPIVALSMVFIDAVTNYQGLNVTFPEALRLMGLEKNGRFHMPVLKPETAAKGVLIDPAMRDGTHYYFRHINRKRSYTVNLGVNRVVMLDTRHDKDITSNLTDVVLQKLGFGSESADNFIAGSPDSVGINAAELELVRRGVASAGAQGFIIVGMHAPPINPEKNEMIAHFRETMHVTADPVQETAFLRRVKAAAVTTFNLPRPDALTTGYPSWPRTRTPYFHIGTVEDLMDSGISVGLQEELAKVFAGAEGARPVTLVLSGHGHRRFDYRLKWNAGRNALEFYTDHYLENPAAYYPMKLSGAEWWKTDTHHRVLVPVKTGTPVSGVLQTIHDHQTGAVWEDLSTFTVPPYGQPLSGASNPAAWWRTHEPVVVQTAALGPGTNTRADSETNADVPGPQFQGFRILEVANNAIKRVHYVTMPQLRASHFNLPWEFHLPENIGDLPVLEPVDVLPPIVRPPVVRPPRIG